MKTYIQPETKVVKVKTVQMMAVSTLGIDSTNKVTDVNDLLGREDNSWDIWGTGDDDEE
ncbi:MAG: hypothetical protein IJT19_09545 [Bacteroidaceae bacterium]|nr:hypothetical protein [Bacteroidaceae bacterium]